MRNDQIFVLLLVVLLPLSGCFDGGGVGEAEGAQDSGETTGTTIVNNYYNNTTTNTNSQERIWYSSGDIVNSYWNDGQDVNPGGQRCLEYGPTYDSSTGEYLGEECKTYGYPDQLSDWNASSCTASGGVLVQGNYGGLFFSSSSPTCAITMKTINTNAGEALILYQIEGVTVTSTCSGVQASTLSTIGGTYGGQEYEIVSGSAMSCSHDVIVFQNYAKSSSASINNQEIWSIVYAIQDTTVV